MPRKYASPIRVAAICLATVVLFATAGIREAPAGHVQDSASSSPVHGSRLVIPMMNAERGKGLFVTKGCVACHSINGVGGHDAPMMDAHRSMGLVNPFDFAAKMWNHAPGMIFAQEEALGEQIYFTGQELADIIAFVHDDHAQHSFSERDLTPEARKMMGHDHGDMPAPEAHAEEVGHGKGHGGAPGTSEHDE
ncbi:MAG: cytochrome c [Gammaproteobacteria bacterium]|nr:cytochrome c [Gammaproteobacteria bacterium]NIT62550.1 cytochrome c [Gammaproteobacteria bacterium]NIV19474.1 c-type cytochrome [Gammaproteobacteria bacterium]NIY31130.1 c-type cytochrome [Gammaproteobacteria bacterium]